MCGPPRSKLSDFYHNTTIDTNRNYSHNTNFRARAPPDRSIDISDYFCAETTKPIPPTPSLGAFRTGFDAAARLHRSVRVKRLAKDASHSYGYSPVCRNSLSAAAGMDGNTLSDYPKPVRPY